MIDQISASEGLNPDVYNNTVTNTHGCSYQKSQHANHQFCQLDVSDNGIILNGLAALVVQHRNVQSSQNLD